MSKPQFTKAECEAIIDMVCIAQAGPHSEGDYQSWTRAKYQAADDAAQKAWEIIRAMRAEKAKKEGK